MTAIAAIIGLVVGSLVNWAAGALPHLAGKPVEASDARLLPGGLIHVIMSAARGQMAGRRVWQAAAVEFIGAALFVTIWLRPMPVGARVATAGGAAFLLLIALIDLRYRLVLNVLVYPAVVLAGVVNVLLLGQNAASVLGGSAFAFIMFWLVAALRPGELGGGDVKLAALLGMMFGFPMILWALLIGIGAGGLTAAVMLLRQQPGKRLMPYAPFLCFGAVVALLYNPLPMLIH